MEVPLRTIKIGCGAGYAGDSVDKAVRLTKYGQLDYLCLEVLAERTIALAQIARSNDPSKGYGQFLKERMTQLLPYCRKNGMRIVSNIGAANPESALAETVNIARTLGLGDLKIAAVLGSDVSEILRGKNYKVWETGQKFKEVQDLIISADAYLGVEQILPALENNADVIITGRVADPSLFLAPIVYEFGWETDDWHRLGMGTVIGHLLECSTQITGGYYADSIYKEVKDLTHVGFPLAEVREDGSAILKKTPGTGGEVTIGTCKEQLLYEIQDPAAYLTPDVTADFTGVCFRQLNSNEIEVTGGSGRKRPEYIKVVLGYEYGFLGEGTICYGGHHAVERAKIAKKIIETRFSELAINFKKVKYDIVGVNSLHGLIGEAADQRPYEVMLRIAAIADDKEDAKKVGNEVENLWLSGPGGPGGVRKYLRRLVAAYSTSMPRHEISSHIIYREVK
jgi:hypothetical protein